MRWQALNRRPQQISSARATGGGSKRLFQRSSREEPVQRITNSRLLRGYHLGPVWSPKSAPIWRRRRQIAARKALLLEACRKTIRSGMKAVPGARRLVLTTQFFRRDASAHEGEHA